MAPCAWYAALFWSTNQPLFQSSAVTSCLGQHGTASITFCSEAQTRNPLVSLQPVARVSAVHASTNQFCQHGTLHSNYRPQSPCAPSHSIIHLLARLNAHYQKIAFVFVREGGPAAPDFCGGLGTSHAIEGWGLEQ